jgi:membrane protease YdiL (CAAX protease family)
LSWSWLLWAASVRWNSREDPSQSLLFLIGGAGPFLAAVALTQLRETPTTRRDFWIRVFDVRRLRWPWWLISLLIHPAIVALALSVDASLGGPPPRLEPGARSVPALLSLLFFTFWFGPLPEEIGWRGFALDRLQARMTALSASLTLGSVWALWHVPLFFVPGSFQESLNLGSPRSAVFLASMIPLSVLMTWVYNNTNRSTLSAVLIHYSGNLCGALVVKSDRVAALELGFLSAAAVLVTLVWGGRDLAKHGSGPPTARPN